MESTGKSQLGHRDIADDIRQRIVKGALESGTRLPGNRRLVDQYGSSSVTVQRAMKLLVKQGYVESIPRRGRFVAEHPPHSHRVALAFPGHPEEIHTYRWTRYLIALQASARRLNEETGWDLVPYFDIEPTENGEMADGYRRLMDDVRSDRLAGIIFGYSPHNLSGTELLVERPLPTVCLTGGSKPWGPSIMVDRKKLLEKAASFFVKHNRRRLAVVTIMRDNPESLPPVLEKLSQQYGFYSPPRWMHPMDPYHPRWVNHTLGTMLKRPAGERPDGLITLDDHLVRPVADALNDLGVSIPEELRIVGYWNFPLRYEGETPIMRLGLDTIEQLTTALHLLREEDGNYQPPGPEIRLEPITASEFKQRHGTDAEVAYEIEPPDREFSNVY
ncbi:MAG: GntR family transcriptional regulator [Planctomycetes bacterium]|nr:GntR family transcriptional regulator [Planctomycetota bacterium]